jgi:VWFA-related protein
VCAGSALPAQTAQTSQMPPATSASSITFTRDEIRLGRRPYSPPSETSLRVRTDLVEVRVVVRDAKGNPVAGLKQEDFTVLDNGKPQAISVFQAETSPVSATYETPSPAVDPPTETRPRPTGAPRFVALFFDDLNLGSGELIPVRKAAEQFITGGMGRVDQVGIFTSSGTVTLEFTTDPERALEALAELRSQSRNPNEGSGTCPRMIPYQAQLIHRESDTRAIDLALEQGVRDLCLQGLDRNMQVGIVKRRASEIVSVVEKSSRDTISAVTRLIEYMGERPGRRLLLLTSSGFLATPFQWRRRCGPKW